jgi:hypothetical protein
MVDSIPSNQVAFLKGMINKIARDTSIISMHLRSLAICDTEGEVKLPANDFYRALDILDSFYDSLSQGLDS